MTTTWLPEVHGDLDVLQLAYAGYLGRYHGNTLKIYEYHLRRYFKWCMARNLDPLKVERAHVEFYVRYLIEDVKLKASTVNSAMTPVKGFYDMAQWDGYIERDPARKVLLPKYRFEKVPPVPQRDLLLFLQAAKESSPRHWALVSLLCLMGLRISEAAGLRIENYIGLDSGAPSIKYVEKGGNFRETPVPLPVLNALERVRGERTEGPMIPQRDGISPLTRGGATGLVETVNRRAEQLGCRRHINPHLLRKMAITEALNMNMPVRLVQEFARHADPRTTVQRYDLGQESHYRHPVHQIAARMAI